MQQVASSKQIPEAEEGNMNMTYIKTVHQVE